MTAPTKLQTTSKKLLLIKRRPHMTHCDTSRLTIPALRKNYQGCEDKQSDGDQDRRECHPAAGYYENCSDQCQPERNAKVMSAPISQ